MPGIDYYGSSCMWIPTISWCIRSKGRSEGHGWLTSARLRGYCKQGSLRTAVFSFAVEYVSVFEIVFVQIILNRVLLVGTKTSTYIGKPVVPNAAVHAVVEEQGLNPKVMVFKYKKKKNYRRNIGHRQDIVRRSRGPLAEVGGHLLETCSSRESGCKPMLADVMNRKGKVGLLRKTRTGG
ncbi:50S ribosomal protein L21, chloroplastic [Vitis vinifera]|uniref:50S ribosomal protein L21, chloroplastic n=1 Tax=Vitis vinifera TaxID=29760 RepID=A0A438D5E3_VITVI|nr:50S ribosomal protein L21, chloroplastic [Vitis vinifera]